MIVKIETTKPGLVGWGCATFTQRALVVQTAVDQYLKPFLVGRNVDEIEDIWQSCFVSSYWRNGPVLSEATAEVVMLAIGVEYRRIGVLQRRSPGRSRRVLWVWRWEAKAMYGA